MKATQYTILFIRNIQKSQVHRDRKQISEGQGLLRRDCLRGLGFPFQEDEDVLELGGGDGHRM